MILLLGNWIGDAHFELVPHRTERLRLIGRERGHIAAESTGTEALGESLGVAVAESWPPEFLVAPVTEAQNWINCYIVHEDSGREVLVGIAGAAYWPDKRTVQIGATVVPEFQGKRLGEEVARALAECALQQPHVERVICDVPDDHAASAKSLDRAGYKRQDVAPSAGFVRFVRVR